MFVSPQQSLKKTANLTSLVQYYHSDSGNSSKQGTFPDLKYAGPEQSQSNLMDLKKFDNI